VYAIYIQGFTFISVLCTEATPDMTIEAAIWLLGVAVAHV